MAEHRVGDVRPTQLLHTYGVGAMVDLPNIAGSMQLLRGVADDRRTMTPPPKPPALKRLAVNGCISSISTGHLRARPSTGRRLRRS